MDDKQKLINDETAPEFLQRVGMNGMLWAIEMNKRFPSVSIDDAHTWCANMCMAGYDAARSPLPPVDNNGLIAYLQGALDDHDGVEINPCNYNDDDVIGLNNGYVALFQSIEEAIKQLGAQPQAVAGGDTWALVEKEKQFDGKTFRLTGAQYSSLQDIGLTLIDMSVMSDKHPLPQPEAAKVALDDGVSWILSNDEEMKDAALALVTILGSFEKINPTIYGLYEKVKTHIIKRALSATKHEPNRAVLDALRSVETVRAMINGYTLTSENCTDIEGQLAWNKKHLDNIETAISQRNQVLFDALKNALEHFHVIKMAVETANDTHCIRGYSGMAIYQIECALKHGLDMSPRRKDEKVFREALSSIEKSIPFIGYCAHVPEIVIEVEEAVKNIREALKEAADNAQGVDVVEGLEDALLICKQERLSDNVDGYNSFIKKYNQEPHEMVEIAARRYLALQQLTKKD